MSKLSCAALALFGITSAGLAAQTAPSQALGQIVSASAASVGGATVPSGGTLSSGDTLSTAAAGAALVKFSTAGQAELSANSSASFTGTPDHVLAKLTEGALLATAAGPETLVVETQQCRIQAQGASGAAYSVTVSPGGGSNVSARRGDVVLVEIASGRRRVLAEGESAACPLLPALASTAEGAQPATGEQAAQAAPAPAAAHNHTGLLLLLLGGGAAAGAGIALAGHGGSSGTPASPSSP